MLAQVDLRPFHLTASSVAGAERLDPGAGALEQHTRRLRNSLIGLAIFAVLVLGLLLAVPGLRSTLHRIEHADLAWLGGGLVLELVSVLGYVMLFQLVFGQVGRRLGWRLALSEQAANAVISVSGAGGLALGAWVLRSEGMPSERVAERSVVLFLMTSAINVGAVVVFGLVMGLGLAAGPSDPLLTLLPAAVAASAIAAVIALAKVADRSARRHELTRPRIATALRTLAEGVHDTVALLRHRDWRLLGAVAYWLCDNAVLYLCFRSFGHSPAFSAVVLAYLIGLLANSVPVPGGFGLVEGGLVGALLLYGAHPASAAIAAVLTYRAISLWLPTLAGGIAFLSLRRDVGRPLQVAPELSS